ncbi:MAG: preprotein translocase subunit YajC [bacterium]
MLIFFSIGLVTWLLILKPQKNQAVHNNLISKQLSPGIKIVTSDGTTGTILTLYQHTVVIENQIGEKIEVLKQAVVNIAL